MVRTVRLSIALLIAGLILGFIIFFNNADTEILISDRMSDFIDAVDRHKASPDHKLIALDLDDTVFMSSQLLGTPTWFYNMINLLRSLGAAKVEAYDIMSGIDKFVQERTNVVLVEQTTHNALKTWQKMGVTVFGFSSRLTDMVEVTNAQLQKIDIAFNSPYFSCIENNWPKDPGRGSFKNGVLYVSEYRKKVETFITLFELLKTCGMKIELIGQADDQQRYITEMASFSKQYKTDFIAVIYGAAFANRVFDIEHANRQLLDLEYLSKQQIVPEQYRDILTAR